MLGKYPNRLVHRNNIRNPCRDGRPGDRVAFAKPSSLPYVLSHIRHPAKTAGEYCWSNGQFASPIPRTTLPSARVLSPQTLALLQGEPCQTLAPMGVTCIGGDGRDLS